MKRRKFSFVGVLVSVTLALAPITYAPLDASGASSGLSDIDSVNSANSDVLYRAISGFKFAGQLVSWQRVMNIAKDPVIDWGTIRDDHGNLLQGELWLIVAKNDKFIYFHLTDTPNSASNTTAYGGYTVKIKAIMTNQFYGYGYGGAVPVIGNDTDAFLSTTTEIMVNSAFIEGEPQRLNISTGAVIEYLVHLYEVEQSYSMPRVGSTHWTALQYFAPDGTELTEPFSQSSNVSASSGSSSSTDCEAAGDKAGQDYITNQRIAHVVAHGVLFPGSGIVAGLPGLIAEINFASLLLVTANLTERAGSAVTAAITEGLCEALSTGDDIPVLPPIELNHSLQGLLAEIILVCVRYETELQGSTGRDDGEGGVIVEGETATVCAEWRTEVKVKK